MDILINAIVMMALGTLMLLPAIMAVSELTAAGSTLMIIANMTVSMMLIVEYYEPHNYWLGDVLIVMWLMMFIFALYTGFKGYKKVDKS